MPLNSLHVKPSTQVEISYKWMHFVFLSAATETFDIYFCILMNFVQVSFKCGKSFITCSPRIGNFFEAAIKIITYNYL